MKISVEVEDLDDRTTTVKKRPTGIHSARHISSKEDGLDSRPNIKPIFNVMPEQAHSSPPQSEAQNTHLTVPHASSKSV